MAIAKYFSLQGQSGLVSGGGNGIGKAICLMFAEFGADVACTDLNLDDDSFDFILAINSKSRIWQQCRFGAKVVRPGVRYPAFQNSAQHGSCADD